jgi:hypothetical protein
MPFTARGVSAEIRWAWHCAAKLGAWTLTDSNGSLQLTADVQEADDTRVSQHPLTFVVSRGDKPAWRWPVHTLQISAGTLTASLVPEE